MKMSEIRKNLSEIDAELQQHGHDAKSEGNRVRVAEIAEAQRLIEEALKML